MDPTPPDAGLLLPPARGPVDYGAIFRATAAPSVVLTPEMTIAAVNDAYLTALGRARHDVVGADLVGVLRGAAVHEPRAEASAVLRASLLEVARTGKPDVIDVLPYPLSAGARIGGLRFVRVVNAPVLDGRGNIAWILHQLEEVITYVDLGPSPVKSGQGRIPPLRAARHRSAGRRNRKLAVQASHDRVVSRILQDAMLTELPEPRGVRLGARYIANTEDDQVGGDWYDAAVLTSGATIIAMGDVVGHDINAAASMGQLRGLLRALAWDREEPPAAVFERVERGMAGLKLDTLATAVLGRIQGGDDRGGRHLEWSNAGHPPPLLVTDDGVVEILETENDLPLGAGFSLARHDHRHPLTTGSILILYTDGLVERRDRTRDAGIEHLAEALRRHRHLPLEGLLDELVLDVAGDAPEDDIAVLAVAMEPDE